MELLAVRLLLGLAVQLVAADKALRGHGEVHAGFLGPKSDLAAKSPDNATWKNVTDHSSAGNTATLQSPAEQRATFPHFYSAGANHSANTSWQQAGTIYFLFLVNNNLPHIHLWKKFFASAPPNSWKALVHCKDPAGCAQNGLFGQPEFQQVDTVPTWYCHDLVTAMAHLARVALQNPPKPGEREKFVFLSESTLPVKPFNEIHAALAADDDSDFCLFPVNQWGSSNIDGAYVQLAKHHQWVVLSRSHADLFVKNWVPVNAQSHWRVWVKSGTWQAAPKTVLPQNFYYPSPGTTCADEWAMMATIFGALEPQGGFRQLIGFGGGQVNMNSHLMQGRCRTWTFWDHTWDLDASALANQIATDVYGSGISCFPKCWTRPAELYKLSAQSLTALRTSPFLFARKFSSIVSMPEFERIIIR